VLRGLGTIKSESDEVKKNKAENSHRINYVRIDDGDIAFLRFLTEDKDFLSAQYHKEQVDTPNGLKTRYFYCPGDSSCKWHAMGHTSKKLIFAWAYVYYVLHKGQNPKFTGDDTAAKWSKVSYNSNIYFKETVDQPMIFRTGPGKDNKYEDDLVKFSKKHKTLVDRDYTWFREGEKLATKYTLDDKEATPLKENISALISTLPDLSKIVTGEIYKFGQEDKIAESNLESLQSGTKEDDAVEEIF
jgi:hypothetical protein